MLIVYHANKYTYVKISKVTAGTTLVRRCTGIKEHIKVYAYDMLINLHYAINKEHTTADGKLYRQKKKKK